MFIWFQDVKSIVGQMGRTLWMLLAENQKTRTLDKPDFYILCSRQKSFGTSEAAQPVIIHIFPLQSSWVEQAG